MSLFWESFKNLFKKETNEEKKEKVRIKKQRKRLDQVIDFFEKALKEKDLDDIKHGAELLRLVLLKEYQHYCPDNILKNAVDDESFSYNVVVNLLNENLTNKIQSFGLFFGKICSVFSPEKYSPEDEGTLKVGLINENYMNKLFNICKKSAQFFPDEVSIDESGSFSDKLTENRKIGFAEANRVFLDAEELHSFFSTPWEDRNNKKFNSDQKDKIDGMIKNIKHELDELTKVVDANTSKSN